MPTGKPTEADLKLISEMALHGVPISIRQLQDWRRKGIISGPNVVRHGRRGTESVGYSETAPLEVARVYYLLQEGSSMADVVVSLFGVGVTPTERALRSAYSSVLDTWEKKGRIGLVLADEPGTAYSQRVRRFAASIGRASPSALAKWNDSARERARAESEGVDFATNKRMKVSTRDIRERDTSSFLEAFVDGTGDPFPILESMGMPSEAAEFVEEAGGWPAFSELRDAIDSLSFEDLVLLRDKARLFLRTQSAPIFSEAIVFALREEMDDPSKLGLSIAFGMLFPIALDRRVEVPSYDWRAEETPA